MRREIECCAYVLHRRNYRNSSLIIHFLCAEHGIISAVAKGAAPSKTGKCKFELPSFSALNIHLQGRGELLNLNRAECQQTSQQLAGKMLFCGLYLNELCSILAVGTDGELFELYHQTLQTLARLQAEQLAAAEIVLRFFELNLLELLGYGIDFVASDNQALAADQSYQYALQHGFVPSAKPAAWRGEWLIAVGNLKYLAIDDLDLLVQLSESTVLRRCAKSLLRQVINNQLNGKILKSRELFA